MMVISDKNSSYWYELQDKGSDFFLSLNDPMALESLFPTVLLPIDENKAGAITYDLKKWSAFKIQDEIQHLEKKSSKFNFWIPLYIGLRLQLRACLGDNYMGYQIFTYKKKHLAHLQCKEEKASFGSWIFDAPSDMFEKKGSLKEDVQNEIASKDIAFISSALLSKDAAKQVLLYWGSRPKHYNGYAMRLIVMVTEGRIHCSFDGSTKAQKKFLKEFDLEDAMRRQAIERGLEFMLTNAFRASRFENRFCEFPKHGGILYTPTLYKGNDDVASATLVFYGGEQKIGSRVELNAISSITRSWGLKLETVVRLILEKDRMARDTQRILGASVRAAIGSIMSRNGSHNIGSHVLAALADNVGTMPDDKVLYQYIQHRMDYIATATTDFPAWRQPTMFLGTMMKAFLSQRHLLDNIAGSEGLRAWKFQGRKANLKKDSATIKFHIRKLEGGTAKELLIYNRNGGNMCLDGDVSLAIPGGTVGQHAFFTIIENIIRNAAKHDWSSPPPRTRRIKFNGDKIVGNLEVYIDFRDIPEEGNVEFVVFTNMSHADEKVSGERGETTLLKSLEKALSNSFIDEEGKLRKEDWGIAEMKISAGYLQGREPGVIGGLKGTSLKAFEDNYRFGPIIRPVRILQNRVSHLGYAFKIPKARTLLIVVKEKPKCFDEENAKRLAKHGIYIKSEDEAEKSASDNSFEFVLMDSFTKDKLSWRLPFRIVCTHPKESCERTRNLVADWMALRPGEDCTEKIVARLLQHCDDEDGVGELIENVYASWIRYLKKVRGLVPILDLVVSTEIGKDNHSGQSLVNAAAAVKFVFDEGMSKAVESFYQFKEQLTICAPDAWKESDRAIKFIANRTEALDDSVCQSDAGIRQLLVKQMSLWLQNYDKKDDEIPNVLTYLAEVQKGSAQANRANARTYVHHPFKLFVDYLVEVCKQAKGYLGQYAEEIATLPKGYGGSPRPGEGSQRGAIVSEEWESAELRICFGDGIASEAADTIKYYRHYVPIVSRDDSDNPLRFVTDPFGGTKDLYIEPLSGTQSYFTQLQSLSETHTDFSVGVARRLLQTKLVECALLRVLIIDERVSRFVKNHSDQTVATFSLMNIAVVDDVPVTDELESKGHKVRHANSGTTATSDGGYTKRGLVRINANGVEDLRNAIQENDMGKIVAWRDCHQAFKGKYDILIVHQGILDKWFKGVVNDKRKMVALYEALKNVFPYVVITTGRGTPANIPNMARVLPFSTIETTLFRKYPEKLVLVDAIMNILPVRKS